MKIRVKQLAHKFVQAGAKSHPFTRHYYRDNSDKNILAKYREKHNNTEIYENLYTMTVEDDASKDAKSIWQANKEQAVLTGDFVVDLDLHGAGDKPEAYDTVRNDTIGVVKRLCQLLHITENQMKIYWSGGKGFHVVVPYAGLLSAKNLNKGYRRLAQWLNRYYKTIDLTLYDEQRVCRIPNSIHGKTGMYCVRVSWEQLQSMDLIQMMQWAFNPRPDEDVFLNESHVRRVFGSNLERLSGLILRGLKGSRKTKKRQPRIPTVEKREGGFQTIFRFKQPGVISESAVKMSIPQAIKYVKSSIDMEELTGLHGQFCDIFHEEKTPSSRWLRPNIKHRDWIYKCSSSSAELAIDPIGFTMCCLHCTPMEALEHLCSKANIKLVHSEPGKDIREFIRANKLAYKNLNRIKGAHNLIGKVLKGAYDECCADVQYMAEHYNMDKHADNVYGSVSSRYLSKRLGNKNGHSSSCKKLILLASLGLVKRFTDEDLPFYNTIRRMPFYKKCMREYYGCTIQFYKLADLSNKEVRKVIRDRIRAWVDKGAPIKNINRQVISDVFGEEIASDVYAKHDALMARRAAAANKVAEETEVIAIDNIEEQWRLEEFEWLRKEMRENVRRPMFDDWVFVPAAVAAPPKTKAVKAPKSRTGAAKRSAPYTYMPQSLQGCQAA